MAIEPKTKLDQEKNGIALQRLSEEDPTSRFIHEEPARPSSPRMGELHLESHSRSHVSANSKWTRTAGQTADSRIANGSRRNGHGVGKLIKHPAYAVSNGHVESICDRANAAKASCSKTRSSAEIIRANTSRPLRKVSRSGARWRSRRLSGCRC